MHTLFPSPRAIVIPTFVAVGLALIVLAATAPPTRASAGRDSALHAVPVSRLARDLRRRLGNRYGPGRELEAHVGARQREQIHDLEQERASSSPRFVYPEAVTSPLVTQPGLAADALVNNRTVLTCSQCQGLPIAQDEASVAVHGKNVVVSFNDIRSRCGLSTRQNIGHSSDGGATLTDNNGIPKNTDGGNLWGDPSVAVNHKTGEFYVAGFYQVPFVLNGIGGTRAHFSGSSLVFDGIRPAAIQNSVDSYDKPWMAVDSTSGNVYFSWTNFGTNPHAYLEFVRCDSTLTPLGPVQVLNDTTVGCGTQDSQIAVGPGGVVYVVWNQSYCDDRVDMPTSITVRRSDDFGATFGPQVDITPAHAVNINNGGPGFQRIFASAPPTVAIDNSTGPHRGRVYVAWDQALDFLSAPLLDRTTRFETEPNNTPASANVLVPGGKLRGTKTNLEDDWFSFHLNAGETFYETDVYTYGVYDSTREDVLSQIYSPDLAGNPHLAANGDGGLLYTAARTGTYYLRLFGTQLVNSPYDLWTALIPATSPTDLVRDVRDQVLSWSDDGAHWSPPVRINDSAPGCDAQYPSLSVDGRGRVYCAWMDWRDDPQSGTASTQYMTISGDGGNTWGVNQRIGDAVAGWPLNVCQSNGNTQGDYQMMAADGDRVVTAFTDGRLGDPDIFVDASVFADAATAPPVFVASAGSDSAYVTRLFNRGNFGRQLSWHLEDTAGWLTGVTSGIPTLAAGDSLGVAVSLHPSGQSGDSSLVRLIHGDPAIPGYADTVNTMVRLTSPAAVPLAGRVALFLSPPAPNPSRGPTQVRFSTATSGRAQVTLFSINGARVRTLLDEPVNSGPHEVHWDGRDAGGRPVPAGSYLVRLTSDHRNLTRRIVVAP